MTIEMRTDAAISGADLAELFRSSGINRPFEDLDRMDAMLRNASLTITAWDGETLVGVARALTDFAYACYLSDLAVRKEYQRRGVGKRLIERLQRELGDRVALILLAAPAAADYYEPLGFQKIERGWIIPREG